MAWQDHLQTKAQRDAQNRRRNWKADRLVEAAEARYGIDGPGRGRLLLDAVEVLELSIARDPAGAWDKLTADAEIRYPSPVTKRKAVKRLRARADLAVRLEAVAAEFYATLAHAS